MSTFDSTTPEGVLNYLIVSMLVLALFFGVIFWLSSTGALQP